MLDTRRAIETPEGVELGLRVAGPPVRAMAWLIDALIRGGIDIGIFTVLSPLGPFGTGVALVLAFLNEWFYYVLFEVYRNGATPGKRAMAIRAVHDDGTPIAWGASMVRNLLRVVDFLPMLYAVGLTAMVINRDFKRLGDLGAGTLVVYADRLAEAPALPKVAPQPPPLPLLTSEQHALVRFAERAGTLTPERAEELADLLTAVSGGRGPSGVRRLLAYANYLVGRR